MQTLQRDVTKARHGDRITAHLPQAGDVEVAKQINCSGRRPSFLFALLKKS